MPNIPWALLLQQVWSYGKSVLADSLIGGTLTSGALLHAQWILLALRLEQHLSSLLPNHFDELPMLSISCNAGQAIRNGTLCNTPLLFAFVCFAYLTCLRSIVPDRYWDSGPHMTPVDKHLLGGIQGTRRLPSRDCRLDCGLHR